MAATPFDTTSGPPGSSFVFDIYNDGQTLRNAAAAGAPPASPVLPGGPCNYTDLNLPRCGCRRFWSRISLGSGFQENYASNLAEVCMCSHHACFHEDVLPAQGGQVQQAQPPVAVSAVAGQENLKPRTNREPLSPVQDLASFAVPSNLGSFNLDFLNFEAAVSNHQIPVEAQANANANPLLIQEASSIEDTIPVQDSPLPDTLNINSWGQLVEPPPPAHLHSLPPFSPQCLLPNSQGAPPSIASSTQSRYLRPFAGKGLHTLVGGSVLRHEASQRADEAPAPEQNLSQDGDRAVAEILARAVREATPKAGQSQERQPSGVKRDEFDQLSNTVKGHEQRLDRLENTSFSVAGHEECHDKHENVDLRVTELESRVEEVEKILNDSSSIGSRRTLRADANIDDATTASVASVSTNATSTNRAELYSEIQSLRAQISQLQAASLPSYTKPWELEVVFLPFPLKGIWIEGREFANNQRAQSVGPGVDEWAQMPNTISRATPDPHSPKFAEWQGQGNDSNWLLPRAFVAGKVIDQRLRSRGLIKNVLVRGPDARSIQLAIHHAFADIFRISSSVVPSPTSHQTSNSPLNEFHGLRQAWVPLRKIHKDSRLRFLGPAEMTTPALWDFTFLVSSVVMKATGMHRLYITQPEAYLQDHPLGDHAFESGWTWQKLRELSRVYPDSQGAGDGNVPVPEADALEEYWGWNEKLDDPPTSANASALSLRQSRISRRSSSISTQFYTGIQSPAIGNSSAMLGRAQSPMIQRERKGSRPPPSFIRTGSLPPAGPSMISPSQSRRRVSTGLSQTAYERRSSPFVGSRPSPRLSIQNVPVNAISKSRRLGTRSPSVVPQPMQQYIRHTTPRWSRASKSRSPSLAPNFGNNDHNGGRRTTPFYYATPHSDAIPDHQAYGYQRGSSRGPIILPQSHVDDDMDDGSFEDGSFEVGVAGDGDIGDGDEDMTDDFEARDRDDEEMKGYGGGSESSSGGDDGRGGNDSTTDPYDSEMTQDENDHQQGSGRHQHHERSSIRNHHGLSFGRGQYSLRRSTSVALDVDVYEDEDIYPDDEEDGLDGLETDTGQGQGYNQHQHQHQHQHPHQPTRPEDIPWAGIEDHMSDSENVDPFSTQELSSQQQSSHHSQGGADLLNSSFSVSQDIEIHEDEDVADAADGNDDNASVASSQRPPSEYSSKPSPMWKPLPTFPPTTTTATIPATAAAAATAMTAGMTAGFDSRELAGKMRVSEVGGDSMGFQIHEDGTGTATTTRPGTRGSNQWA